MQTPTVPDIHKYSCIDCKYRTLCLPAAMDGRDILRFDAIVQRTKPVQPGKHLYKDGEKFTSIFAIHSGSVKTYIIDAAGAEQVTGFYLPGEMAGFDGIDSNSHGCNVVALETSTICRIPFPAVVELAQKIPALQHHLFRLMSQQIATDFKIMFSLSKQTAIAKVATLMVNLSRRFSIRNYSALGYRLPMSRMDIGNFLGLSLETVSRTLGMLHRTQIIRINGRDVLIKDPVQLEKMGQTAEIYAGFPHTGTVIQPFSPVVCVPAAVQTIEAAALPRQRTRTAGASLLASL